MKRLTCVIIILCVAANVLYADDKKPGELGDPLEILKKVDAATKAVKSVSYAASVKGVLAAEPQTPVVQGTVIMSGWVNGIPENFRLEATVRQPGSYESTRLTVGSDGEVFYLIDHKNRKAYVGTDPTVIGNTGRPIQALLTLEFLHPTPFGDEINSQSRELKGSRTIGGEDCYEIHVLYAGGRAEAIWHFSKRDFLPRARLDFFILPSGERGGRHRVLTEVVVDPEIDAEVFKLNLPQGYTKTDHFAP